MLIESVRSNCSYGHVLRASELVKATHDPLIGIPPRERRQSTSSVERSAARSNRGAVAAV